MASRGVYAVSQASKPSGYEIAEGLGQGNLDNTVESLSKVVDGMTMMLEQQREMMSQQCEFMAAMKLGFQ